MHTLDSKAETLLESLLRYGDSRSYCNFYSLGSSILLRHQITAERIPKIGLKSHITIEEGAVAQSNYHDYPIARISSYPGNLTTRIANHPFSVHATHVRESGPPIAPALANGISQHLEKRLYAITLLLSQTQNCLFIKSLIECLNGPHHTAS